MRAGLRTHYAHRSSARIRPHTDLRSPGAVGAHYAQRHVGVRTCVSLHMYAQTAPNWAVPRPQSLSAHFLLVFVQVQIENRFKMDPHMYAQTGQKTSWLRPQCQSPHFLLVFAQIQIECDSCICTLKRPKNAWNRRKTHFSLIFC